MGGSGPIEDHLKGKISASCVIVQFPNMSRRAAGWAIEMGGQPRPSILLEAGDANLGLAIPSKKSCP